MRDHGGNIDAAIRAHGGGPGDWIDLSTGINRVPYPLPPLPAEAWTSLPTRAALDRLIDTARAAWGVSGAIAAVPGAQGAIQILPRLMARGTARILSPTYNEHAGALRDAGWQVEDHAGLSALEGAALAVVVNPNNPDGRTFAPDALLDLAGRVGHLLVDESFADPDPGLSLAGATGRPGLTVLRSFGKFYGLAGVRLGFVLGDPEVVEALQVALGPWPVSGPAIAAGTAALADRTWAAATGARLARDADRADALAAAAGWRLAGGCALFRLYDTGDAAAARDRLARARIWSRRFPWSDRLLRLGLPGSEAEWARLAAALSSP